jgi:hypothetical protein
VAVLWKPIVAGVVVVEPDGDTAHEAKQLKDVSHFACDASVVHATFAAPLGWSPRKSWSVV